VSFVLDASMTVACYFEDERSELTDRVLVRLVDSQAFVPVIWRLEVANSLRTALRRNRINRAYRAAIFESLSALPILVDPDTADLAWSSTLELSDHYDLTIYDAAYLELAARMGIPLASLDSDLRAAARAVDVEVL
jgi:predicted nucleic acid-binding protein